MNRNTLAAGAVAVTAILVLPAAGQAAPEPLAEAPGHPCFLVRAHWNEAIDGPQPTCGSRTPATPDAVRRPGLDHLP
jgi:hypothetical protein